MVRIILKENYYLKFFGWERVSGELNKLQWPEDKRVQEKAILRGGGWASWKARSLYPVWMVVVFFKIISVPKKSICFCLGWETAFPAIIASFFKDIKVVFDDADRFSMLLPLPAPINSILVALEKWTSRKSYLHIVPGWARYEWKNGNMMILRNTPLEADYSSARSLPGSPMAQNAELVIYVNGWIAWDTGASVFLDAFKYLEAEGVDFIVNVAGNVVSEGGKRLVAYNRTIYHGELSQLEALRLYMYSDVVLTFYDPQVQINHYAESNKWGDCVFLRTPFIVNSEVKTASRFVERGAALSVPYNDYHSLARLLKKCARDSRVLEDCRTNLDSFVEEYEPYDVLFAKVLHRLGLSLEV